MLLATGGKTFFVSSHQTIRLIRGRHSTPERGACVMEVASMLASEPFSDQPRCVCPVIGEFLRTYNDQVDDERRQDLYACASLVVDTREGPSVERRRADHILDWWLESATPRRRQLRRFLWKLPPSSAARDVEIAHRTARWAAASRDRHADAIALVEALVGASSLQADPRWAVGPQREAVAA